MCYQVQQVLTYLDIWLLDVMGAWNKLTPHEFALLLSLCLRLIIFMLCLMIIFSRTRLFGNTQHDCYLHVHGWSAVIFSSKILQMVVSYSCTLILQLFISFLFLLTLWFVNLDWSLVFLLTFLYVNFSIWFNFIKNRN